MAVAKEITPLVSCSHTKSILLQICWRVIQSITNVLRCPCYTWQCPCYMWQCPCYIWQCPCYIWRCPCYIWQCPCYIWQCPCYIWRCPYCIWRCPYYIWQCPYSIWRCPCYIWRCPYLLHIDSRRWSLEIEGKYMVAYYFFPSISSWAALPPGLVYGPLWPHGPLELLSVPPPGHDHPLHSSKCA
jgi:hypothetical protein